MGYCYAFGHDVLLVLLNCGHCKIYMTCFLGILLFHWFAFTGIMLLLVISIAWHCFLLRWVMYFGLLSLPMVSLFCSQCLVLVILFASFEIPCVVICSFIMSRAFHGPCLLIARLSSVRLYYFRISTVLILHRLLLWVVTDLFSGGLFLWACGPALFFSS